MSAFRSVVMVMHLGDDLFEGAVNSQFQKKSDGAELAFVIPDWAAKVQAGYTKATVYLDAKGWQTDVCNNLVGLSEMSAPLRGPEETLQQTGTGQVANRCLLSSRWPRSARSGPRCE